MYLMCLSGIVKHQIQKRGIRAWRGMGHLLRQLDQEGDGRLNKYELEKALVDYHIDVPNEVAIIFTYQLIGLKDRPDLH